ncbi:ABC transporter permease subunit [Nocardia sp. SYP-A9097]|nr:ABC transporter permease subunit [Nocardia sp. SYP-A9097]
MKSRLPQRVSSVRAALTAPTVAAAFVLGLIVLIAIAPGWFTDYAPTATDVHHALLRPGGAHWFGTDQLGRDVFARVLYGTRPALLLGFAATLLAVVAGTVVGLLAALGGGFADQALMRATDVLLALPPLLLALLVIAALGAGTTNIAVAVAIAFIPLYARLVRSEALAIRHSGYVEAATMLGLPRVTVIARHIVPNALGSLLVMAPLGFGTALLYSSALSFLGLGIQPPQPEWGSMLSEGKDILAAAWWVGVFPGAAVTGTVIAVNVLGRTVRVRLTGRGAL